MTRKLGTLFPATLFPAALLLAALACAPATAGTATAGHVALFPRLDSRVIERVAHVPPWLMRRPTPAGQGIAARCLPAPSEIGVRPSYDPNAGYGLGLDVGDVQRMVLDVTVSDPQQALRSLSSAHLQFISPF